MPQPLDINALRELIETDPRNIKQRKQRAQEIARIGAWDSELELRNQEYAYKSARKGDVRIGGVSDNFPVATPKRRRVSSDRRRNVNLATVAVSFELRAPELYWYSHDIAYYANAYANGHLTRGEWREIVANVKLMGPYPTVDKPKRDYTRSSKGVR